MNLLKGAISGRGAHNSHSFVVDEIGRSIVKGIYPVGATLPGDLELASHFQVSRTVLREAMKTLTAKGMLIARARVGTRVTERKKWNLFDRDVLHWHFQAGVDPEFLDHLCHMRLSVEPYAAQLAAEEATRDEIGCLYRHTEIMRRAPSSEVFTLADLDFHLALLEASRNPFMWSVGGLIDAALLSAFRLSSPSEDPEKQAESALAHRRIAEGIERRDGLAAAEAMRKVIIDGRNRVRESDRKDQLRRNSL
jgi:DNA-binding FadR family transcriptional regulator